MAQEPSPYALLPAPTPISAAQILSRLFSQRVDVSPDTAIVLPAANLGLAYYVDDKKAPAVHAICEAQLICRLGAALTRVHPNVAEEALRGTVPEIMLENHNEVMNVLSRALNRPDGPSVRLERTTFHRQANTLPPEFLALRQDAKLVVSWSMKIAGYGGGRLTLFESARAPIGPEA